MQNLLTLEKEIFQLDENNLETCVESVIQLFGSFSENPYSYNLIICQLVYYSFVSKTQDAQVYISFLNEIDKQEEKCSTVEHKIITIFSQFLLRIKSKESIYLLEKMLENKLIDPELIKNKATLYFSHYKTKDDIPKENLQYSNQFFTNKEELEKDDWKLHKKLVEDGVNPLDIAQALRNDDIDKLQEIATQSNFNFNQSIEPSLYERFSYVSRYNVTLIDYAAFFGSIKCFKYLMLNGANLQSTGKYAVLGGNHEIIHLCEQSNASFVGSYEAAIELHRNEIFYYLYDQKLIEINLIDLGIKCIQFSNFEILSFLMNEGLTINEKIIEEAAKVGNIYLFNMFNKENKVINELLQFSVQSGNIELVQQIIKMDGIKINEIYYHLLMLKFIFLVFILDLKYSTYNRLRK